jgi:hypothetical protein
LHIEAAMIETFYAHDNFAGVERFAGPGEAGHAA